VIGNIIEGSDRKRKKTKTMFYGNKLVVLAEILEPFLFNIQSQNRSQRPAQLWQLRLNVRGRPEEVEAL